MVLNQALQPVLAFNFVENFTGIQSCDLGYLIPKNLDEVRGIFFAPPKRKALLSFKHFKLQDYQSEVIGPRFPRSISALNLQVKIQIFCEMGTAPTKLCCHFTDLLIAFSQGLVKVFGLFFLFDRKLLLSRFVNCRSNSCFDFRAFEFLSLQDQTGDPIDRHITVKIELFCHIDRKEDFSIKFFDVVNASRHVGQQAKSWDLKVELCFNTPFIPIQSTSLMPRNPLALPLIKCVLDGFSGVCKFTQRFEINFTQIYWPLSLLLLRSFSFCRFSFVGWSGALNYFGFCSFLFAASALCYPSNQVIGNGYRPQKYNKKANENNFHKSSHNNFYCLSIKFDTQQDHFLTLSCNVSAESIEKKLAYLNESVLRGVVFGLQAETTHTKGARCPLRRFVAGFLCPNHERDSAQVPKSVVHGASSFGDVLLVCKPYDVVTLAIWVPANAFGEFGRAKTKGAKPMARTPVQAIARAKFRLLQSDTPDTYKNRAESHLNAALAELPSISTRDLQLKADALLSACSPQGALVVPDSVFDLVCSLCEDLEEAKQ